MKRTVKGIIATGIFTMSMICSASAVLAEDKPDADLTIGAYSKYVWRGYELSDDSIVIQPSMTVAYKGFGFNLWGNLDTDLIGVNRYKWNETDMTLSYDGAYEMVGYGVGWIYYALDGVDDSQDLYLTLSLDTLLAPSLTIYKDISGLDITYYVLGISHSIAINDKYSIDLGATGSYLNDDDNDYSALHNGVISVAVPITINDYISVSPELYYSFALSSDAEDNIKAMNVSSSDDDSFFYGGLSVSFAF